MCNNINIVYKIIKSNTCKVTIVSFIFIFSVSVFCAEKSNNIITLQDYFQEGQNRLRKYNQKKDKNGRHFAAVINKVQKSCVQIEAIQDVGGRSYAMSMGSGVIVGENGHLIRTVGHTFEGIDKDTKIEVIGPDGQRKKATLVHMALNRSVGDKNVDNALLKIEGEGFGAKYSAKFADSIRPKEMVVILGYAKSYGLDENGNVQHTMSFPGKRLAPLSLLGHVGKRKSKRKVHLTMEAGAMLLPGASGGPVFNMLGELVGDYTAYITEAYVGKVEYKMSMQSIPKNLDKIINPDDSFEFASNEVTVDNNEI